jgi:hypothetical protein
MVCAPERLVFEASPDLEQPLKQEKREAKIREGMPLDTRAACIKLDKPGQAHLKRWKGVAARALKKEAAAARMAFVEEKAGEAASRGMDPDKARLMAEQWGDSVLRPGVILEFDDRDLGAIDVAALLADPARFDGETLADPIEGVAYGRNCAIVQLRDAVPSCARKTRRRLSLGTVSRAPTWPAFEAIQRHWISSVAIQARYSKATTKTSVTQFNCSA